MELYTVYKNPLDYPGKFVIRKFTIGPGTVTPDKEPLVVGDSLEEVREKIPDGFSCFPAFQDDDPVIEEVWL